ncbi:MAG: 23S rRNA (adenine(2030)-N(6))-methyltransferase RlmJ [Wenzhouxiangella sp.]
MLSYQHGYHAGNPADVFKHTVLLALLSAMQEKPNGIVLVDTHAGAARYRLDSDMALKTAEFRAGIEPLWARDDLIGPWQDYRDAVAAFNPDGELRVYPGSPLLMRSRLRRNDRLFLCELHPREQGQLSACFDGDRQVEIIAGDGYQALEKILPPPGGRGLVMIDPSFELKDELDTMTRALKTALRRFAHGVYLIWYPIIEGRDTAPDALPAALGLTGEQWLDLRVAFSPAQRLGRMTGCGMAVINCPWRARALLTPLPEAFQRFA